MRRGPSCKRLKLRCDRRNPCGSCVKRDTVQRCQYTAAAAEKIDVQSLHNRLQIVESQLAQIFAGGLRVPTTITSTGSDNFPFPHNDRTMLAVGASGSSVTVSLDDVAALWLEHLEFPRSYPVETSTSLSASSSSPSASVKLEPSSTELAIHDEPTFPTMIPSFSIFFPTSSSQAAVTPSLVAILPSAPTIRSRIITAVEETMKMRPCFNVKHFRARVESMFAWAKEEDGRGTTGTSANNLNAKAELARSIFFPTTCAQTPVTSAPRPAPTLSFFASVSVAYALGVLVCKENEASSDSDTQKAGTASKNPRLEDSRAASSSQSQKVAAWNKYSASGLFALSRQAMAAFEMVHPYDLDAVVTYLLQIIYLLHDSRPRVAHFIYPLLGKVIHIGQMMGLSTDPDEFPGKYNLFEAEQRRRIWWDIYYYDVFVSDAIGQAPSIQDGTFTTKLPADVDEEQFVLSSTSLPLPIPRRAGGDPTEVGFAYFIQKCRLAQLVKNIKMRYVRDTPNDSSESSVERAEQFESEVKSWLSELPRVFRFDTSNTDTPSPPSSKPSVSSNLQAQRCELAIIANQLILKVFLPYLKNCNAPSADGLPRRVVSSVVDAGHAILQAMRILHTTWRQAQPAAFLFYSFGRTLFDTAVMMACAVIAHPSGASAGVAITDIAAAIDIMQDTRIGSGRRPKQDDSKELSEAVKIVTLLKTKAEAKRAGEDIVTSSLSALGAKRKREDSPDANSFADGFELPYVGVGVKASSHQSTELRVDTTPKAPIPMPKVKAKQRQGTTIIDLSSPLESSPIAERDVGQVPIRGRPRTDSTLHRSCSSKKYNAPTTASTHSQSGTPAPEQPGFHPMPELTRPESRPQMCSSDYETSIYTPTSSYEPSSHYPMPPSMPPPQAPPMHASPSYASLSGSGSSSQSSPAYSQAPIPSPHPYRQPGPELYSVQGPTTPSSYDPPMASLNIGVSDAQSHHGSVPPEEPPYMMASSDPCARRLTYPHQQNGTIALQNFPPTFAPGPHGILPPSAWQPNDGLPPRPTASETWQDYGKYN
ncbi:hypothetical protein EI94DRAFT_1155357 [Lactarius quietus]|nr:hypothetical protein EI94DRAFT_1155357 [Lactarius quietus]